NQINILNRASISTIHAFCTNVVKKYFYLIDVDPNFRIGDTTETSLMRMEAIEEVLELEYAQESPAFLVLAEMFGGGRDDAALARLVLKTYQFIQSKPNPLEWLKARAEDFNMSELEFASCKWAESIKQQLRINLYGARDLFSQALEITEMLSGPQSYQPALVEDVQMTGQLIESLDQGLSELYQQLRQVKYSRLGRVGKDTDAVLQEEVKELRAQGKKVIESIQSKVLFQSPELYYHDLNEIAPQMEYLCTLAASFASVYQSKKTEKGILDFNDLEHFALEILSQPEVSREYQKKYEYIFVDEYQDSNQVQENILNWIKRGDNLFLVGDVKQSIYRFRLSDPSLFLEKYASFSLSNQGLERRIDLHKNFRSSKDIIAGINCIFKYIMSRELGEIDYNQDAYLYPGITCPDDSTLENPSPDLETFIIDNHAQLSELDQEQGSDPQADDEPSVAAMEAQVAAARIQELCGQHFYDSQAGVYRPLQYKDMVILMRATRNKAEVFADTLRSAGVPVFADVDRGYFQTLEISIFLNLLKIIDNKRQDIPLLSVLRSPIGNFSIDDMIAIRLESQSATYYEAIEEYLAKHSDNLQVRLQSFLDQINAWKEAARYTPMDEFIWKLLLESGYYHYVGAMPGGLQRQANLRILFNRAGQFQNTSLQGLFQFIKYMEKVQASSGDMGMAKISGENENVVHIMSIHKSKGLEFPVVILAGMGNQFNLSDTKDPILFHKDLGLGPNYVNPELRINRDTLARISLKYQIKMESLAEEMRILYVACTRPRNKLIMIGTVSGLCRKVKTWNKKISPFQLAQAKCQLDWIGPVLLRHPDGINVRELAANSFLEEEFIEEEFRWRVEIMDRSQIVRSGQVSTTDQEFREKLQQYQQPEKNPEREWIEQRLNWQYPYREAVEIPSKLSVSQIKNLTGGGIESLVLNIPQMIKRPRFISAEASSAGRAFSGAEKGSIVHFVMQHLDLNRLKTVITPLSNLHLTKEIPAPFGDTAAEGGLAAEIKAQILDMIQQELLREDEAQIVDITKIINFLQSELGERVLQAEKVYREASFNLECKAADITDGWQQCEEEELLVQGIIDLYFWEGQEMVILDYKTDRITSGNRKDLIDKYRIQIELYKIALERIQGYPVKESYIYLFDCNEEVRV
ncbi:MAG: helicase-exonuclease AddAB subunit AddA, partial [Syntrophomonas sp.]|nr:helicase-exonuclease AddAB subunit AddA [Syntrophomonas sp.]